MTDPEPSGGGVAVCLTASFLGFFSHAGFLETLVDHGVVPRHVSGASAGAYVAGLYAAGFSPARIREILLDPAMVRAFWDWPCVVRGFPMLVNWPGFTGVLSGRHARNHLRGVVGDQRIEDCTTAELTISVSNLTRGRAEIVREGSLVDFVAASCAVPGLFVGVRIGDCLYWDGGVADAAPIGHWLDNPRIGTIIIHAIDHPEHAALLDRGPRFRVADAFNVAHHIIQRRIESLAADAARRSGKRLVICRSNSRRPRFGDHAGREALIEIGRRTALAHLAEFGLVSAVARRA